MFDTNENTVFPSLNSHTLPHRTSTWDQLEILSRFNLFQLLRSAVLRMCICVKFEHFNGACGVCPCDSEYKAAVCFRALGSPLKAVYCACLLVCVHTVMEHVWKSEDCLWELILSFYRVGSGVESRLSGLVAWRIRDYGKHWRLLSTRKLSWPLY